MSTWIDSLDGRPGVLPETRILNNATVLVVFQVAWGPSEEARGRLVLRFDQKGGMYAALQRESQRDDHPDDQVA